MLPRYYLPQVVQQHGYIKLVAPVGSVRMQLQGATQAYDRNAGGAKCDIHALNASGTCFPCDPDYPGCTHTYTPADKLVYCRSDAPKAKGGPSLKDCGKVGGQCECTYWDALNMYPVTSTTPFFVTTRFMQSYESRNPACSYHGDACYDAYVLDTIKGAGVTKAECTARGATIGVDCHYSGSVTALGMCSSPNHENTTQRDACEALYPYPRHPSDKPRMDSGATRQECAARCHENRYQGGCVDDKVDDPLPPPDKINCWHQHK